MILFPTQKDLVALMQQEVRIPYRPHYYKVGPDPLVLVRLYSEVTCWSYYFTGAKYLVDKKDIELYCFIDGEIHELGATELSVLEEGWFPFTHVSRDPDWIPKPLSEVVKSLSRLSA